MSSPITSMQIHATCLSFAEGQGVLLLGDSGSGKSDLALRLIDAGATLVADDRVDVQLQHGQLVASAPAALASLLEVRGVGIMKMPYIPWANVSLAVQLVDRTSVERLPEPAFAEFLGVSIPRVSLCAFDVSTPLKIKLVMQSCVQDSMHPSETLLEPAGRLKLVSR